MRELTWLITGSSRGFGRALGTAALAAGDQVLATARNPEQVADLEARYQDRALAVALDVTDQAAMRSAVAAAVDRFGRSRSQLAEADAWASVSRSAEFGQDYPVEFPADRAAD